MSETREPTLKDMMSRDAEIRQKRLEGKYENPEAVRSDVERFLDDLPKAYDDKTVGSHKNFRWACRAIVYWNSFLRSDWKIAKFVPFPPYVPPK